MKTGLRLLLMVVTILTGCVGTAHLYPVQGPLSTQTVPPVLTLKATISRSYTVNLDGGETCTGTAALVPLVDTSPNKLPAEWDAVYGSGFYVAHVLGTRSYVRATLTGNKDTVMSVETYNPGGTASSIKGVAKDSNGNVFKVTV